ncbi:MAG: zinc ribbon domain-containing protein [Bacillota bacterium]|nr:zinc ribbon domain-containing protein [Bacillota bacterium]
MFCEKCGAHLEEGTKFCGTCGSAVRNTQAETQGQTYSSNQNTNYGSGAGNSGFGAGGPVNNGGGYGSNNNTGYNPNGQGQGYNGGSNNNTGYNTNAGYNNSQGFNGNAQGFNNGQGVNPNTQGFGSGQNFNGGFNNNNTGYNTAGNNFTNGYGVFQQPSPVPKSKKPVFVAILAVVLVIALLTGSYFTFGKQLLAKKDPVNKTINSVTNIKDATAVDSETVIKVKLNGASGDNVLVKSLAEDMAVKVNSKYNKDKSQADIKFAFVMKDQSLADIDMYVDQDIVVISSEGLLDKPLYFNMKDIQKLAEEQGQDVPSFNYKDYEPLLKNLDKSSNYKAMSSDYRKFFEDVLKEFTKKTGTVDVKVVENGKERTIKCDESTITIDENFIKKVVVGLLDKASTDKNLKALIKEKADEFYKVAEKNGDLEKFGITADSYKEAMSQFDSSWDEAMTQLKDNMGQVEDQLSSLKFNSTAKFKVDSDNRLRQVTYEVDAGSAIGQAVNMEGLSGSLIIETTFNAYDGDVKISKPSTSGAKNLAEMSEYDLMNLMSGIEEKAQKIFGSNFGGF